MNHYQEERRQSAVGKFTVFLLGAVFGATLVFYIADRVVHNIDAAARAALKDVR